MKRNRDERKALKLAYLASHISGPDEVDVLKERRYWRPIGAMQRDVVVQLAVACAETYRRPGGAKMTPSDIIQFVELRAYHGRRERVFGRVVLDWRRIAASMGYTVVLNSLSDQWNQRNVAFDLMPRRGA